MLTSDRTGIGGQVQNTDWASLAAGFVGVLVGGALTFFGERHFRSEERKTIRLERLNRLHRFTARLINELLVLHKGVVAQVPENPSLPLWMHVQPLVGHYATPVEFSLDDLGLLGGPKFGEISGRLELLAQERNAIVATLAIYNEHRARLMDALAPHVVFVGNGELNFKKESDADPTVVRLRAEANDLAVALVRDLRSVRQAITDILPGYNSAISELYGPKQKVGIEIAAQADLKSQASA